MTDRGVVWHAAYKCPHCGAQIEQDDQGATPADVRKAILEQDGTFELRLMSALEPLRVMKVLRDALGLSLEEANEYRKRLPGPLATGTHAEMKWLASRLDKEHVPAVVAKIENG